MYVHGEFTMSRDILRFLQNTKWLDINQSIKINEFVSLYFGNIVFHDLMKNSSMILSRLKASALMLQGQVEETLQIVSQQISAHALAIYFVPLIFHDFQFVSNLAQCLFVLEFMEIYVSRLLRKSVVVLLKCLFEVSTFGIAI